MSGRADRYRASGSGAPQEESYEELTKKLGTELRPHIRAITQYPLFSGSWCAITETLQHVASVALMEDANAAEDEELSGGQQGVRKGSLWDREDLCVRFILEEGKLNVLLRMVYDTKALYRKCKREPDHLTEEVEKAGTPLDVSSVEGKLQILEGSVGTILKVAFDSEEVLQTCDMPLLIQHIAEVLTFCIEEKEELEASSELSSSQESLAFHYLKSIATHLDVLDEERVFELIVEHKIIGVAIAFLRQYHEVLAPDVLAAGAKFLAGLAGAELFKGYQNKLFPDKDSKKELVELKGISFHLCLNPLLSDSSLRKTLRPLSDLITRFKLLSR